MADARSAKDMRPSEIVRELARLEAEAPRYAAPSASSATPSDMMPVLASCPVSSTSESESGVSDGPPPPKLDDIACSRIVALAEAYADVLVSPVTPGQQERARWLEDVAVADDVVLHTRRAAHARDRVGILQTMLIRLTPNGSIASV